MKTITCRCDKRGCSFETDKPQELLKWEDHEYCLKHYNELMMLLPQANNVYNAIIEAWRDCDNSTVNLK